MLELAKNGFSREQVINQFQFAKGNREISFRYELLNNDDVFLGNVEQVEGELYYNSLAEIKRTASFKITRNIFDDINWVAERIKPYFQLKMPGGTLIEWSLGVLLLSSPIMQEGNKNKIIRDIKAYDKGQILKEDKFVDRYYIAAGTNYIDAIKTILYSAYISRISIEETTLTLPTAIEFEIGTTKLEACNQLLSAINYYSLTFDEQGYAISKSYVEPANRGVEYGYRTNQISVIVPGAYQTLDLFNAPNIFVRVLSDPERDTLKSVYKNDSSASPLSTVNRKRNIVDYDTVKDVADQATLDAYVRRIAINSNQIYGELEFETAVMPHHTFLDCLYIEHDGLQINDVYIEKSWEMQLNAGGVMNHICRKVVKL